MKNYIRKIEENVRKHLTEKRFQHTQGVKYTAACLAMRFGIDIERAQIAGLLHDCAKCISDNEMLEKCEKYSLSITDVERKYPYLLHAKLGAYYAHKFYNIEDEEILSAITYHTTGNKDMSKLEKIVFIADFIEPNRKVIPNLDIIREKSFENLDTAMYLILKNTLDYLDKDNKVIDVTTITAYEYYKSVTGIRRSKGE